jgi:hypothetical protein
MRIEKRKPRSYFELSIWDSWPEMFFGLEFSPTRHSEGWSIIFGLTIFYKVIIFMEYTRFNKERIPERDI